MPPVEHTATPPITGGDINAVLRLATSLRADGNGQLTLLARAFVVACKSCQVDEARALPLLAGLFREPADLVPLPGPDA